MALLQLFKDTRSNLRPANQTVFPDMMTIKSNLDHCGRFFFAKGKFYYRYAHTVIFGATDKIDNCTSRKRAISVCGLFKKV